MAIIRSDDLPLTFIGSYDYYWSMAQDARRQISIRTSVWMKALKIRDALTEISGRRVTIADTVDRALDCLQDAHTRGAWLTPKEAAPVLEERLRREVVSVLTQFIARTMPDRILRGVTFEQSIPGGGGVLHVHLDDRAVPMLMGAADVTAPQVRTNV